MSVAVVTCAFYYALFTLLNLFVEKEYIANIIVSTDIFLLLYLFYNVITLLIKETVLRSYEIDDEYGVLRPSNQKGVPRYNSNSDNLNLIIEGEKK